MLRPNEKKGGEKFAVWEYKCDQVSQRKKRRKTETKSGRKVGRKVVTFGGAKSGFIRNGFFYENMSIDQ